MTELIVFPDVEDLLTTWLQPQLETRGYAGIKVGTRVPSQRPSTFVRLILTGGARHNLVQDNPTVVYEAWSDSETAAAALAQLVRALLASLAGQMVNGVQVYRVGEFAGPQNLPDPDSGQIRYTGTVSILIRGASL